MARLIALSLIAVTLAAGCDMSPTAATGFRLPDGDPARGREVFVAKECASCHFIAAAPELRDGVTPVLDVEIGGATTRVATYGELVTSVINPSHRIARGYRGEEFVVDGESVMLSYNEVMTVSELIDLVAFLQSQYQELPDY